MPKQAIIYARISPKPCKKNDSGEVITEEDPSETSCEVQRQYCEKWCQDNGFEVIGYYQDKAVSGSTRWQDRKGLSKAVESARKDVPIIAYAWDRFARSPLVSADLQVTLTKAGSYMINASNGQGTDEEQPDARLMRRIVEAIAEYELTTTSRRTSDKMRQHQANGRRMSARVPYGTMVDPGDESKSKLIPCPAEQATLAEIMKLHNKGLSPYQIAKDLNTRGLKPRMAKQWSKGVIKGIVEREGG